MGADIAEQEIIEALEDGDSPVDIVAGKLLKAVKKGVLYAGEQMVDSGVDIFEEMKEKSKEK